MRRPSILFLPLLALAACAEDPIPVLSDPRDDTCGAEAVGALIGEPVSAYAAPEDGAVRIIRPGDAVTMDFNAARLNVALDETDRIVSVYCG